MSTWARVFPNMRTVPSSDLERLIRVWEIRVRYHFPACSNDGKGTGKPALKPTMAGADRAGVDKTTTSELDGVDHEGVDRTTT